MIWKFVAIYQTDIGLVDVLQSVANCATQGYSHVVHVTEEWVIVADYDIEFGTLTDEDISVICNCETEQWYDDEGEYEFVLSNGTRAEVIA